MPEDFAAEENSLAAESHHDILHGYSSSRIGTMAP
jgi:hypothetical protein